MNNAELNVDEAAAAVLKEAEDKVGPGRSNQWADANAKMTNYLLARLVGVLERIEKNGIETRKTV